MIFRKPYAFLIKYFRFINGLLSFLLIIFLLRLNNLHIILKSIFLNNISNYSALSNEYIGYKTIIIIVLIIFLLFAIILLFRKKNKPLKDYLYCFIYIFIIIAYLFSVSSLFLKMQDSIIEQTKLSLYNDISFLIYLPLIYFIVKFLLIFIGFNIKKFDFTKDIETLKSTSTDDEEVEVILNKHTYRYARGIRKYFRELKYYYLENKLLINIILFSIFVVFIIYFFSYNIFFNNNYKINTSFDAGTFTYKVDSIFETNRDYNNVVVKKNYKFVIVNISVNNNYHESKSIDFNDIRLFYGKEYVYSNNFYNKYFLDLGNPYNGQTLPKGKLAKYSFIFKIPNKYNSNKYKLKIYDKVNYTNKKENTIYKVVNLRSEIISKDMIDSNVLLNSDVVFDKQSYGDSYLNIKSYDINNNYKYNYSVCLNNNCVEKTSIISSNDANKTLLILEYNLNLDNSVVLAQYFTKDNYFFESFLKLKYTVSNKEYYIPNISVINSGVDKKVFLVVPVDVRNASSIKILLNFRNKNLIYKLK